MKDEIKYDQRNYRDHDERNLSLIKKSIQRCGAGRSILLDKNGEIIAGNATYKTLQELGIPVKIIPTDGKTAIALQRTDLDTNSRKRKELAAFDNSTSDKVHWNFDNIAADFDLSELPDFGIEALPDMEPVEPVEEDDVPNVSEATPRTKKGDIWQLGEHRLMCGDSTVIADVEKLMAGEKADMVFTDPPYGVKYTEKNKYLNSIGKPMAFPKAIDGDSQTPDELHSFLADVFKNIFSCSGDKVSYYITAPQGAQLLLVYFLALQESGFALKHMLIWNKNNHVLGLCDYHYKHEPILYGWKEKGTHVFYGGGQCKTTVWDFPKPQKNDLHPTMKPVALVSEALLNSSQSNDIVLDLFGGSGTTLIACEQLGRKARLMEIDPHYCDVIITRWESFTGKQAQLL